MAPLDHAKLLNRRITQAAAWAALLIVTVLASSPAAAQDSLVWRRGPGCFVSKPYTVDVLGSDSTGRRVYYLATAVTDSDSLHSLRGFELTSSRPQESRTYDVAVRGQGGDSTLVRWVHYLQRACVPLDYVTASGAAQVSVVGPDSLRVHDETVPGYRLLVSQGIGPRRRSAYALCRSSDLRVRAVLAVRGRPEALAVLEMPRGGCDACNPLLLMLLSRKPLPVRTLDPSLGP